PRGTAVPPAGKGGGGRGALLVDRKAGGERRGSQGGDDGVARQCRRSAARRARRPLDVHRVSRRALRPVGPAPIPRTGERYLFLYLVQGRADSVVLHAAALTTNPIFEQPVLQLRHP